MTSGAPQAGDGDGDGQAGDGDCAFPAPLSAQQARAWRSRQGSSPLWQLLVLQLLACMLAALLTGGLTGRADWAWSLAYGALAVLAPAALLARAVRSSRRRGANAQAALLGFVVWELVKMVLTVALLVAAPRLLALLSWPALIVGMLLAMKTYWVASLLWPGFRKTDR